MNIKLIHNITFREHPFIIIFFLMVVFTSNLLGFTYSSHEYKFQTLSVQDGLPFSSIRTIYEDSFGFIWFGTGMGLCRYDGVNMKVYQNEILNPASIPEHSVDFIFEDTISDQHVLFIGFTMKGLALYHYDNENFSTPKALKMFKNSKCQRIIKLSHSRLLFLTSNELIQFNNKSEILNNEPIADTLLNYNSLINMYLDQDGILHIFNENGVFISRKSISDKDVILSENDFINYTFPSWKTPGEIVLSVTGTEKSAWIGKGNSIYKYSLNIKKNGDNKPEIHKVQSFENQILITDIEETTQGIFVGTSLNSLYHFNPEKPNQIKHYKANNTGTFNIKSNRITDIYTDSKMTCWIGTYKGGVSYIYLGDQDFKQLNPSKSYSVNYPVFSILPLENGYFLTGSNLDGVVLSNYHNPEIKIPVKLNINENNSNQSENILSFLLDSKKRLWMCSANNGVYCFENITEKEIIRFGSTALKNKKFRHFTPESHGKESIKGWSARKVVEDNQHNIWIGTWDGGLNKYNESDNDFTWYDLGSKSQNPLLNQIRDVYIPSQGWDSTIFISTIAGVILFKSGKILEIINKDNGLSDDRIWKVAQSGPGEFFIGTSSGGINILNFFSDNNTAAQNHQEISKHHISYLTSKDGLSDNSVNSIFCDKNRGVWFTSETGLYFYNPNEKKIYNCFTRDELHEFEFNFGAFAHDTNSNILFFGSSSGLIYFNPDSISFKSSFPNVIFTELKILNNLILPGDTLHDRVILEKSILNSKQIDILQKDRVFTVGFVAPEFINPDNILYRYKLVGFDQEWNIVANTRNFATYSNIPPGDYIFQVSASNKYGVWPDTYNQIYITVHPAWWNTIVAKTFYIFLLLFILFILYRIITLQHNFQTRLKLEKLKTENERNLSKKTLEVSEMKTRFFMNISHELRTPLTLIVGPVSGMLSKPLDKLNAKTFHSYLLHIHQNANRLQRLINQLLDYRKLETETYKLQVTKINITDYLQRLFESFEYEARQHSIDYRCHPCDSDVTGFIDTDILEKVLYNLISNAFKFTPDKGSITLWAETDIHQEQIKIEVSDTGFGIEEKDLEHIFDRFYQAKKENSGYQRGTGIGLSLTRKLVQLHKGTIYVKSEKQKGSTFSLQIPIAQKYYSNEEISDSNLAATPDQYKNDYTTLWDSKQNFSRAIDTPHKKEQNLLLVDDNPGLIGFLTSEFEETFNILSASTGKNGLKIALNNYPDIIVCDVMMPEMDGFEFTRAIKTNPASCHIPVILLTARTSHEDQLMGLDYGADDYISKPFEPNLLMLKIRNILRTRQALQKRFREIDIQPKEITVNSLDEEFLSKVFDIVNESMHQPGFNVEDLAAKINLSRSMLLKKLKALTGESAASFINTMRMKSAAQMLSSGKIRVSDVAYKIGYVDPLHFSKNFKKYFGISPTQYSSSK